MEDTTVDGMDSLKTLLDSAYAAAKRGEYQSAFEEFRIILSHNPRHVGALYGAAACQYRLSNPDLALEFLERLLKINPNHTEALRLLREVREGAPKPERAGEIDPVVSDPTFIDPFGTGLDRKNRAVEIIPEWRPPGRDAPGIVELFQEGRKTSRRPFRIGRAYIDAWKFYRKHFGKLVLATWISLLSWFVVWLPFVLWFSRTLHSWFFLRLLGLIATFFVFPTVGLLSCYCFRLRREENLPVSQLYYFIAYYPGILVSQFWIFLPVPLGLSFFYGFLNVFDTFTGLALAGRVYPHLAEIGGLALLYFWLRCWFLHQSAYLNLEDSPLTVLGRAYYSTRWQLLRVLFFVLLQTVFLILGTLILGLGTAFVHAAQTEAFLQTQEKPATPADGEEGMEEDIGFVPKRGME